MNPRYLALLLLVVMLGFAGLMASVGFLVREPLPVIARHHTLELESTVLEPPVSVRLALDGGHQVTLVMAYPGREAPPELVLAPFDGAPLRLDWEGTASAQAQASGQLTRPGRWELSLSDGPQRESFAFIVQE
ncbi:MAG: hypothetical protein JJT95_18230 [Pararhodobacter sp.]|nr:hypothetical protein [Pararhodobacter sp.]